MGWSPQVVEVKDRRNSQTLASARASAVSKRFIRFRPSMNMEYDNPYIWDKGVSKE
jgi:hypothetical protein